eukprot:5758161-Amphidinium_carterae.1
MEDQTQTSAGAPHFQNGVQNAPNKSDLNWCPSVAIRQPRSGVPAEGAAKYGCPGEAPVTKPVVQ